MQANRLLSVFGFRRMPWPGAFITHKKQRGRGFFQRYSFQVRGKRRPHQDMPRINHKGYGGDKQYRQRFRPQVDRGKFGAAGKVHPRHQQHFQPGHTFLPALHSEY